MKDQIIKFTHSIMDQAFVANQLKPSTLTGNKPFICAEELHKYFDIGSAQTIYVRLSHTPSTSKNSYEISRYSWNAVTIQLSDGRYQREVISMAAQTLLKKFGYPLYLSIEL